MKTMTPARPMTDEMLSRRPFAMRDLSKPAGAPAHQSIRETLATHLSDPAHRFHAIGGTHDDRVDVAASGALQRKRGRRH